MIKRVIGAIRKPEKIGLLISGSKPGRDLLSDAFYLKCWYKNTYGERLNLKQPETFNEKIQWLKLHDRKKIYTVMVDKYEVREYLKENGDGDYSIPMIAAYDAFEKIKFDMLPRQFVIKCSHDSGGVVIVTNKELLDYDAIKKKIDFWMSRNYYYLGREWPYKNVTPRIIIEKYLENNPQDGLHDYKVWCFNGVPVYIQYITGRLGETQEAFFDRSWRKQRFSYHNPLFEGEVPKPACLENMLSFASKYAENT